MQPEEFKQNIADPYVSRYYQYFSKGNNGVCPKEEDLTIQVVSSVGWTKHAYLDAANGVCSGRCLDIERQSPGVKVSVMTIIASSQRPGDWNTREIVWFHPAPEGKARFEFVDPAKTRKAYFHSCTLVAPPYSGF